MLIFLLLLSSALLQGVHSGLFPGNHYGKVDKDDVQMLHSRNGDHEMEKDGHEHASGFCGDSEQSPVNIITKPEKEIEDEHELEPPEAESGPEGQNPGGGGPAEGEAEPGATPDEDVNAREPAPEPDSPDNTASEADPVVTGVRRRREIRGTMGKKRAGETGKMGMPIGIKVPKDLTFTGYNRVQRFEVELTHGGAQASFQHAKLSVKGSAVPPFTYSLQQFHFHWGMTSAEGSEHYLDDKKFSMEMHLVHLSHKFKDVHAALNQPKGKIDRHAILVLGILIQAKPDAPQNPEFDRIVRSLSCSNHTTATSHHTHPKFSRVNLFNLIPKGAGGMTKVVTYDGSLTTHNCNEVVSWFVFTEPLVISESQIAPFRRLYDDKGVHVAAEGNAREVKPHNERNMYIKQVQIKSG